MEELKTTIDNGEIQFVHIAPIGEFVGSDADGKPVPEKMTVESLTNLANKLNSSDEVLCDIDHGASKKGAEKETAAAGWFTRFIVDPIKGLFATLKLTKKGKELLENREYRYTSPTFVLDGNGEPVDMHSVSLTNLPAFKGYINPVLNTESTESTNEEIVMTMTKDELVNLIKETVVALNTAPVGQKEDKKEEDKTAETTEEKKEETPEEKAEVLKEAIKDEDKLHEEVKESLEEKLEDAKDEAEADNSCSDKVDDVKNEMSDEAKAEVKEEIKEEIAEAEEEAKEDKKEDKEDKKEDKEDKKEEVITLEALNTAPVVSDVSGKDKWMNLHGDEFFKYLREHPEIR